MRRAGQLAVMAVVAASGCGTDVRLGTVADAAVPIDVPDGPFAAGAYTLTILDPVQTDCNGSLAGTEASFSAITRSSANLVDGTVMLTHVNPTEITLSGAPIATAFGQPTIDLTPNPGSMTPGFPQTIWDVGVMRDFGTGPQATQQNARYFGIDAASASTPTSMEAAVALLYEASDTSTCSAVFPALLASQ
jgi:hypothetical protein